MEKGRNAGLAKAINPSDECSTCHFVADYVDYKKN